LISTVFASFASFAFISFQGNFLNGQENCQNLATRLLIPLTPSQGQSLKLKPPLYANFYLKLNSLRSLERLAVLMT
jgi:hypothetical protein